MDLYNQQTDSNMYDDYDMKVVARPDDDNTNLDGQEMSIDICDILDYVNQHQLDLSGNFTADDAVPGPSPNAIKIEPPAEPKILQLQQLWNQNDYTDDYLAVPQTAATAVPTTVGEASTGVERPQRSSAARKKVMAVDKESPEYKEKRRRNNVAVRKSRDKAKYRQNETERKLKSLQDENVLLKKKLEGKDNELAAMRGLINSLGLNLTDNSSQVFPS
ncbi:uncharacterized protein LOC141901004 [Tubulanus polymorphus]|uniref:uncharacterized protein LOC141901004 n=1 Tax=Tubulanus polymorphus TaxID=672921 RepID=UPI003DA24B92